MPLETRRSTCVSHALLLASLFDKFWLCQLSEKAGLSQTKTNVRSDESVLDIPDVGKDFLGTVVKNAVKYSHDTY